MVEPWQSHGTTWWSRGDLMCFQPDDQTVERWRIVPDGARRVEVWALG